MDWLISNPENPKGSDDSWHFNFGTYFANCDLLYLLQTKIKHFYFWPNTLLWRTHHQRKRLFSETKKPVRLELGVLATPDTSIILILMQCYRVLLFYKKYESHISFFTAVCGCFSCNSNWGQYSLWNHIWNFDVDKIILPYFLK